MGEITWVEEGSSNGHATGSRKRKVRPKRFQFVGWGSRQLIEFLQSLGKDTTNKISRFEVSEAIGKYIAENGLLDSSNKKKVACDDRLVSLFGARTILRMKVYDLLEKHYEENQDDSDFDYLYEDEPQIICHSEKIGSRTRKVVEKKPRGTFAAIVSDNVKLVYLRKSLVQELVKSPETFEGKMLGSFVRIKPDPNDYLQINPYQLVQVTGVKKEPGTDDFLLQVTNYMKDVSVSMLSDDNFSQEECEDLHQRIKNGSLKKPTIVEMEEKARNLHEDQTKHWLGRETSRLLREVPEVIGEELVPNPEASLEDHTTDSEQRLSESPISSIQETPEVRRELFGGEDQQCNGLLASTPITTALYGMELNERLPTLTASADVEQPTEGITGGETQTKESNVSELQTINPSNGSQPQPNPSEIIELSDDDDEGDNDDGETVDPGVEDIKAMSYDKDKLDWFYKDPRGHIHGPYALTQLKAWKDAEYFNEDFKVWMTGQSLESAVLLTDVLRGV
ncbi:unnamed protein product [Microthlaspi erraticum]|uniref:GYF domain-containing protein n=1 Tax=Microthlaspi erraticum TaxID=1685480 RepID=A0A6D2IDX6_9BRAS|nr:unnamed protein product [Microthlaspi erraticum]